MKLSDIADFAGVSKATASRVISNSRSVSPENIKKVKAAMDKLGFTKPRKYGAKVRCIAVIMVSREAFMEYTPARWDILYGIEDSLVRQGIDMIVCQPSRTGVLPRQVLSGTVDGVILVGHTPVAETVSQVSHLPLVWINSYGSNDEHNALIRNQVVGKLAADYLIRRGHKHLSYLNLLSHSNCQHNDCEFFAFAAQKAGCTVCELVGDVNSPDDDELDSWKAVVAAIEREMRKLARLTPRPTGLFVPIGQITVLAHQLLRKVGLEPGVDIDIVGCGCENGMLASMEPMPATVRVDIETIGRRAVEQLLWKINNPDETVSTGVVVSPVLIEP